MIPLTVTSPLLPRGQRELELRNLGWGLAVCKPACRIEHERLCVIDTLEYDHTSQTQLLTRVFETRRGKVRSMQKRKVPFPFVLEERYPGYWQTDGVIVGETAWISEFPLKSAADYSVLREVIDDTRFDLDRSTIAQAQSAVGEDGIVMAEIGRSPLQSMLYYIMGFETCILEHHGNEGQWHSLFEALRAKKLEECHAAADCETEFVRCTDNIDGRMTSPRFFEEYCVPYYQDLAEILHSRGKRLVVHMDGSLRPLVDLIHQTDIDVIEGFAAPPMGDLSLDEAMDRWLGKSIWVNLPASILPATRQEIKAFLQELLAKAEGSGRVVVGIAENFPLEEGLRGMKDIAGLLGTRGE